MRRGLTVLVLLLLIGSVVVVRTLGEARLPAQAAAQHPGWRTFASEAYGLSLRYPAGEFAVADLGAGEVLPPEALRVIPACDQHVDVCVYYAGEALEGSTLESAGVGVTVHRGPDAAEVCARQGDNLPPAGEPTRVTLGGLPFTRARSGDAGMGHAAEGSRYWTLANGRCLVVEARIGTTRIELYEPGTVKAFGEADAAALRDDLGAIVSSLEFTPPQP